MKTLIKLLIYLGYIIVGSITLQLRAVNKRSVLSKKPISVALFSVRGVKNSYTAGDASMLEFNSFF